MAIVVIGFKTPSGVIDPATLNAVAQAVSSSLREHDVVGDLGDGQLAVALPETSVVGAKTVADRLAKLATSAADDAGARDTTATADLAMCHPDDEGVARALTEVGTLMGQAEGG